MNTNTHPRKLPALDRGGGGAAGHPHRRGAPVRRVLPRWRCRGGEAGHHGADHSGTAEKNPRGRKCGEARRWSLADSAGLLLGARVPITLTRRADSVQSQLASCAVSARRRELAGKVS
jgi:hypothetical protein